MRPIRAEQSDNAPHRDTRRGFGRQWGARGGNHGRRKCRELGSGALFLSEQDRFPRRTGREKVSLAAGKEIFGQEILSLRVNLKSPISILVTQRTRSVSEGQRADWEARPRLRFGFFSRPQPLFRLFLRLEKEKISRAEEKTAKRKIF